jgi:DeoR/GlpR family transcriptional regulator of sugar metabolism
MGRWRRVEPSGATSTTRRVAGWAEPDVRRSGAASAGHERRTGSETGVESVLAEQRRELILEQVRRFGGARVSDLTASFGVSDMTVRRDLEVLARQGLVDKVHGGATAPTNRAIEEPGFEAKSVRELDEKNAIAAEAARLVAPGQAVAIGAGTTTWVLAQHLAAIADLTVVTNSVRVADALAQAAHTVVLTGGVRTPSDALVGPVADLVLASLHVDVAFLGCHGLDARAGLTTPNLAESQTNRAFRRAAGRLVVVADSSKWGTVGLVSFAELGEVDVLVTDAAVSEEAANALRQRVGRVVVAGREPALSSDDLELAP